MAHMVGRLLEVTGSEKLKLEVEVYYGKTYDANVKEILLDTGGSYRPTVEWVERGEDSHYLVTAGEWDVDPNWGDDFIAVRRRLGKIVPVECISIDYTQPNQPRTVEGALMPYLLPQN